MNPYTLGDLRLFSGGGAEYAYLAASGGIVALDEVSSRILSRLERSPLPGQAIVAELEAEGFPSIGCATCTRRVRPGEPPRAGRWSGTSKTECGIFLDRAGQAA